MKSAKEFATAFGTLTQIADHCRPDDPQSRHANAQNVMVYHLRTAARIAREIAEAKTAEERTGAPL